MEIMKSAIELIPDTNFIKFEKLTNQTMITAWDSPTLVAQICIPGEINKDCIINKKTLQMLKLLTKGVNSVDIEVTTSFNIKSFNGKYRGGVISPSNDFELEFDETSSTVFPYNNEIISKAIKFAATNDKRPILMGVNVGSNGVVATDSFSLYVYGNPNDEIVGQKEVNSKTVPDYKKVPNVTIESTFLAKICKYSFTEIVANDRQVLITDSRGVNWYSVLLNGDYPAVSKLISSIGNKISANPHDLKDSINVALASLPSLKEDAKKVSGEVCITGVEDKITITTTDFSNTLLGGGDEFEFTLSGNSMKNFISLETDNIYYTSPKRPIFTKISENELALFLPMAKIGG